MYLIDRTYFSQELNLPQNKEEDIYGTSMENSIDAYIDRYARELLEKALGTLLFKELDSNIEDGNLKNDAPEKWKHLINGVSFSINDKQYQWRGLLVERGLFKESLIANYVYCKWLENSVTFVSGVGEVRGKAVNTENINSTERIVSIWNDFIVKYQGRYSQHNYPVISYHKGIKFTDYSRKESDTDLSLVDYLRLSEDFKGVNSHIFEVKNHLGL